ncbi:MAG: hypothetical protein KGK08_01000 [Acidobacteriota bacterium]|nr:hypothetical protein [Acidobacteriota bacterium]
MPKPTEAETATQQPGEAPDRDACWELTQRIAASASLRRATRLQELLLFLAGSVLKDGRSLIREHEIGMRVFGRPEDYDTSFDNIVRTNVSDLRKRILTYFQSEGAHEPILLEIPRGSYLPVYQFRPAAQPADVVQAGPVETLPVQPVEHANPSRLNLALTAAVLILLLATGMLGLQLHRLRTELHPWKQQPALADFWSHFVDGDRPTNIVLGDSSFALIQDLGGKSFGLEDYLGKTYLSRIQEPDPRMQAALQRIYGWGLGGQGDFALASRLLALAPGSTTMHLYSARSYDANLIKDGNIVLIGSRYTNPWVELFANTTNFTFVPDNPMEIVNHSPAPGEQAVYTWPDAVGYCIVSFLPTPDNTGNALLIQGTSSEATQAAGDFLLSEEQMSMLEQRAGTKHLPYFELLLRTSWVKGTAYDTRVVAFRPHGQSTR